MSHPEHCVIDILKEARINFAVNLPCDRIKNLIPMIYQSFNCIRLTSEEDGLEICAGAWLTGVRPMMIIQSTGIG